VAEASEPQPLIATPVGVEPKRRLGFRRLVPYLLRHKWRLIFGLSMTPLFTAAILYTPQVVRQALAALLATSGMAGDTKPLDPDFWRNIVLTLFGLAAIYGFVRFTARYVLVGLSRMIEEEMRNDLFAHLQRLPARFFDQARIGDLVSRSTQDLELMRFVAGPTLFFGTATLIQLPAALVLIFSISVPLGITVVIAFSLLALGLSFIFPRLSRRSRAVQDAQGDLSAKAQEDFTGIRVLQAFAREASERDAFAGLSDNCLEAQVEMAKVRGMLHGAFVISGNLGVFAVIAVALFEGLAIDDLFAALLYLHQLAVPLIIMGWILQTYHRAKAAADRVDEVFEIKTEDELGPEPTPNIVIPDNAIEARGLSFRYSEAGGWAIRDLSFELGANKTLGIVGPVGSGKSTIIRLLTRLYNPPPNTLFVGGCDVLTVSLPILREQFSIASQDPFLFGDTLEHNVLFATEDAGVLDEVLEHSGLTPDVESFPDGVTQVIGERGVTLSGGQKQRASLARALATKRPVLVLDDTLSAVDQTTERTILDKMAARAGRQTTIVIAHRLEAVRGADLILVMDRGEVVERGTHDSLTAGDGWYARTWAQQQEAMSS